jgi:hypothetical protein
VTLLVVIVKRKLRSESVATDATRPERARMQRASSNVADQPGEVANDVDVAPTAWFTTGPEGWVAMTPQMIAPVSTATPSKVGATQVWVSRGGSWVRISTLL